MPLTRAVGMPGTVAAQPRLAATPDPRRNATPGTMHYIAADRVSSVVLRVGACLTPRDRAACLTGYGKALPTVENSEMAFQLRVSTRARPAAIVVASSQPAAISV